MRSVPISHSITGPLGRPVGPGFKGGGGGESRKKCVGPECSSFWGPLYVDNRCRRVWQKYLGKLEDIVAAVQGTGPAPICAEVFQWGLSQALWQDATRAGLVEHIDRHCPKRRQGLTIGQYLAVAAINRAISPRSKRSMWVWFSQTVLRRHVPSASEAALASQRFWDHMDSVTPEAAAAMGKDLVTGVITSEHIE